MRSEQTKSQAWSNRLLRKIQSCLLQKWNLFYYIRRDVIGLLRPRALPRPLPLVIATGSLTADPAGPLAFGLSSINKVSSGRASGRIMYLIVFPRMLKESKLMVWEAGVMAEPEEVPVGLGEDRFKVILTDLRWVFIETSIPEMVPCTTVPFFNSIVTVSLLNFIKNLQKWNGLINAWRIGN